MTFRFVHCMLTGAQPRFDKLFILMERSFEDLLVASLACCYTLQSLQAL